MTLAQKIALGLGSGLLAGSVAEVLTEWQLSCFALGLLLLNCTFVSMSRK